MSKRDEELERKGKRENTAAAVEQGQASLVTYRRYQTQLTGRGFPESKGAEMQSRLAEVETIIRERKGTADATSYATRSEDEFMAAAKDFNEIVQLAAPMVLRDHEITALTIDSFKPEETIDDSTPKMAQHLRKLRSPLSSLEEHFKPYFADQSPMSQLESILGNLSRKNAEQEDLIDLGPEKTSELQRAKGRLVELIEDMNRVGKIVFAGQAEIVARFNKDILYRARRRKSSNSGTTSPQPPVNPG